MFSKKKSIYLAGPDVFKKDAYEIGEQKKSLCSKYGFIGFYPSPSREILQEKNPRELARKIFNNNIEGIKESSFVLANIEDWCFNPNVDSGTLWEIGYGFSQNKLVIAYNKPKKCYRDRVIEFLTKQGIEVKDFEEDGNIVTRDEDGNIIESFGNDMFENMMIDISIEQSGGKIVDLFEEGLKLAQKMASND